MVVLYFARRSSLLRSILLCWSNFDSARLRLSEIRELTNRRRSHDGAVRPRHSPASPSSRNLNLRFLVKTATLVRSLHIFPPFLKFVFFSLHDHNLFKPRCLASEKQELVLLTRISLVMCGTELDIGLSSSISQLASMNKSTSGNRTRYVHTELDSSRSVNEGLQLSRGDK